MLERCPLLVEHFIEVGRSVSFHPARKHQVVISPDDVKRVYLDAATLSQSIANPRNTAPPAPGPEPLQAEHKASLGFVRDLHGKSVRYTNGPGLEEQPLEGPELRVQVLGVASLSVKTHPDALFAPISRAVCPVARTVCADRREGSFRGSSGRLPGILDDPSSRRFGEVSGYVEASFQPM